MICAMALAEVDQFARVLGAAGLALSLVGTVIAVLSFGRDKPKLTVSMSVPSTPAPVGVPHDSTVVVVVANTGRRPVLVSVQLSSWGAGHPH